MIYAVLRPNGTMPVIPVVLVDNPDNHPPFRVLVHADAMDAAFELVSIMSARPNDESLHLLAVYRCNRLIIQYEAGTASYFKAEGFSKV